MAAAMTKAAFRNSVRTCSHNSISSSSLASLRRTHLRKFSSHNPLFAPEPSSTLDSSSSSSSDIASPTETSNSSPENTVTSPYRVVTSAVVCRTPLTTQPLTNFDREYYRYQRRIQSALSRGSNLEWYFTEGSVPYKGAQQMAYDHDLESPETSSQSSSTPTDADLTSLSRRTDRTLYLMICKNREQHKWQFPQGGVEGQESLAQGAERELLEECGPNMDIWPVGKTPIGCLEYNFTKAHQQALEKSGEGAKSGARVFFHPFFILRGKASQNKSEGIEELAWLTREEIQERVHRSYWDAISPFISRV